MLDLNQARNEIFTAFGTDPVGYQDDFGYIVDNRNGTPATRGEATLHTAIAVVAVSTGNYHRDGWDESDANSTLETLLDALLHHSWGNPDGLGRVHPIRHPTLFDYNADRERFRNSPLTKDSFGAIVAATHYAYDCPHSSNKVREMARELIEKWAEYLVLNQWRTHSAYITGEFDSFVDNDRIVDGERSPIKRYKNIYNENNENPSYKGPEAFLLYPHEIYALQNVVSKLGIPANQWGVWSSMNASIKQTMVDAAAPYIADAASQPLDHILARIGYRLEFRIPIGPPGWGLGEIEDQLEIRMPSELRDNIVAEFRKVILDLVREGIRLNTLATQQGGELQDIAINKILSMFPDTLGEGSWRSILTTALTQISSWLSKSALCEIATFFATSLLMKIDPKPDVVSYTFWSFASEFESRPEVADILKPGVREFFSFLRGNGNPNGLWAWLAEDSGRVREHIQLFESKPADFWPQFAYGSTSYNDWISPEESDKQSPRLDYLVLKGMEEKGPPRGVSDVLDDWLAFYRNLVTDMRDQLISETIGKFEDTGRYSREWIDSTGKKIEEIWWKEAEGFGGIVLPPEDVRFHFDKAVNEKAVITAINDHLGRAIAKMELISDNAEVIEEWWWESTDELRYAIKEYQLNESGLRDILVTNFREKLDGEWIEEFFVGPQKYLQNIWDKRGEGKKLIERFTEELDGKWIEETWGGTQQYLKVLWDRRENNATLLSRFTEELDGKWIEEAWGGAEKYIKIAWSKRGQGATRLLRHVEKLDGKWVEETWGGDQEYLKRIWDKADQGAKMLQENIEFTTGVWVEKNFGGAQESVETYFKERGGVMLRRVIEQFDNTSIQEYWEGWGGEYKYQKFVLSWEDIGGVRSGRRISQSTEQLDGTWVEEAWGGLQKYLKSIWDKRGAGARELKRITEELDDKLIIESWDDVGNYGKTIFDSAGELISNSGISSFVSIPDWAKVPSIDAIIG